MCCDPEAQEAVCHREALRTGQVALGAGEGAVAGEGAGAAPGERSGAGRDACPPSSEVSARAPRVSWHPAGAVF